MSIFDMYPGVSSLAMAGLSLYSLKEGETFKLNDYIQIVPRTPELDAIYVKRISVKSAYHNYYLLGLAKDNRYFSSPRKLELPEYAETSLTLVHQAMCIFHCVPYRLGPLYGYSPNSATAYVLSEPHQAAHNYELDELFRQPKTPFSSSWNKQVSFEGLKPFFENLIKAYTITKEKRWILASRRFTDGILRTYLVDTIIDFAISLEALFNISEKIGSTMGLYMAILIGETFSERQQIKSDIKSFYDLRSDVVHGRSLKIKEKDFHLIEKIAQYLSRALISICGKTREEFLAEIEYRSLLGAPRYSREKVSFIITEEEIASFIGQHSNVEMYDRYCAFLSEPDLDGDQELLFEFFKDDKSLGIYEASDYLWFMPQLETLPIRISWLSKNEKGQFVYFIEYLKNKR